MDTHAAFQENLQIKQRDFEAKKGNIHFFDVALFF